MILHRDARAARKKLSLSLFLGTFQFFFFFDFSRLKGQCANFIPEELFAISSELYA
jgi:hypothetical protein